MKHEQLPGKSLEDFQQRVINRCLTTGLRPIAAFGACAPGERAVICGMNPKGYTDIRFAWVPTLEPSR